MADDKTILIEVDIKADDAAEGVLTLKKSVLELEKELKEYRKGLKDGATTVTDVIKKEAELIYKKKELQASQKLLIASVNSEKNSYNQLSAQYTSNITLLNTLSEEYKTTTEEGKKLVADTEAIRAAMVKAKEATGDHTLKVGQYENATKSMKLELRENTLALAKMKAAGEDTTEAYQKLLKITGNLQDTIADTREEIKRYASDTQGLDMAVGVFTGIGSAAQVAEGSIQLFGEENENIQRGIQKMVAIQGILNGVQELGNALQKESAFMMGLIAAKTKVAAAWQAIYTTAIGATTGATKALRIALLSTGIGAIIVGIGLLVANWDKLTGSINNSVGALDDYSAANKKIIDAQRESLEIAKAKGKIDSEILESEIELNEERLEQIDRELEKADLIRYSDNLTTEQREKNNEKIKELRKEEQEINQKNRLLEIELDKKVLEEKLADIEDEQNARKKRLEQEKDFKEKDKQESDRINKKAQEAQKKLIEERVNRERESARLAVEAMEFEVSEKKRLWAELQEYQKTAEEQRIERQFQIYENEQAAAQDNIFRVLAIEKNKLKLQEEQEVAAANKNGLLIKTIRAKYAQANTEIDRAEADAKIAIAKDIVGNLSTALGEGTALGKAAAVAQTTMSTYEAATSAYASASKIPVIGAIAGPIAAAAAVAAGLANVKKILAVKTPGGKSAGGGGNISASTPSAATQPIQNINPSLGMGIVSRDNSQLGTSNKIQLTPTLVQDDVTSAQKKDNMKTRVSTI